jgi:tetratricopeptide (TPR) repeat protein
MKAEYDIKEFGVKLREYRLLLGWTAKQLALLYSEAIGREDNPIDLTFIYRLEAGKDMLVDKGRRALLARLVDMPLAIAGISLIETRATSESIGSNRIDTKEYADMLEVYCDTWQQGTTYKVVKDIKKRVCALERTSLYSPSKETTTLLCEYLILIADVQAEQTPVAAIPILTETIALSKQEKLYNIYAHALRQRAGASIDTFEQTGDYSILHHAVADFQATETVQRHVSPFYQGMVDIRRGLVYACLAQDQGDFKVALDIIDSSSEQIGNQGDDKRIAARLDEERYRFNRASAYLYSRQGSPTQALKELDQAVEIRPITSPRRGVHRDLLYAETYIALQDYPMAIACVANAIEVSAENGMDTLFNRLENVYRTLRNSPYGKDLEVARLGVQLLKAHHPEVFL